MLKSEFNAKKYLQRVIIVSWLSLLFCFFLKITNIHNFDIVCKNETFISICEYATTHIWADYAISAVYCFVSLYLFTLSIIQQVKFNVWQLLVVIITVFCGTALKMYNRNLGVYYDIWQMVGMPFVLSCFNIKKLFNIVIGNVLLVAFQIISMYTKNLGLNLLGSNLVIDTIYGIDVIIMLALYYAYANLIKTKKGEKFNE